MLPTRLSDKIAHMPDGCWLWTASTRGGGYGQVRNGDTVKQAHRVVYELLVGPIPEGLVIDHLCRQRTCVNPDHMEIVTHQTNILRGNGRAAQQARQVVCIRGHELSVVQSGRTKGKRYCKECRHEATT